MRKGLFFAAVAAALLLVVLAFPPPRGGLLTGAFFNALHVPVFAALTVCLYFASRGLPFATPGHRAGVVLAVSLLAGVASEIVQAPIGRDASLGDMAADWCGSSAALLALGAWRPISFASGVRRGWLAAGALALLVAGSWPFLYVSAAYLERNLARPVLFSFDARLSGAFVRTHNASLQVSAGDHSGRRTGIVTSRGGPRPGIVVADLYPDWRNYRELIVELEPADEALTINVQVTDRQHRRGRRETADRFGRNFTLAPGGTEIRIPLADILDAPRDRTMNLADMYSVGIFTGGPDRGLAFGLVAIRLE